MTPSCWAGMPVLSTPLSLPTWNSEPGSFWGPQISSGFPRPLGKSHDPSPYLLPPGWAHRTGGASGHAAWGQAPRPAADGLAPGPQRPHSDLSAGRRTRRAHPPSACGHRPKQQPPWQPGTREHPVPPPPLLHPRAAGLTNQTARCTGDRPPGRAGWTPCWTGHHNPG